MYDHRPPKGPNDERRIEAFGFLLSDEIAKMMRAFAEVRASLKGQSLEPEMLRQISVLAAEVKKGTASAPPTAVNDKPTVVDSSQLLKDFPGFIPGPVVDEQSITEVVSHYRTLGLSAVGCNNSRDCRIYYDPAQKEGEFSFQL